MHCKKCLHYEVCVKLGKPSLYGINQEIGCSAYKDKEKWAEKKDTITNADRIRAMSDEGLAEWMAECNAFKENADASQWLPWLKQPAEEV